jgi:hypothetical protein
MRNLQFSALSLCFFQSGDRKREEKKKKNRRGNGFPASKLADVLVAARAGSFWAAT